MIANFLRLSGVGVFAGLCLAWVPMSSAAPIVAGPTSYFARAIQDVTLFGGTAINPGPTMMIPL